MLMALNDFKFEISDIAYQSFMKRISCGFSKQDRIGNYTFYQASKEPKVSISISGTVYPYHAGAGMENSLADLALAQEPLIMTSGTGDYLGEFIIKGVSFSKSSFLEDGQELINSFTMELAEYVE